jgi:hypothetical protein
VCSSDLLLVALNSKYMPAKLAIFKINRKI